MGEIGDWEVCSYLEKFLRYSWYLQDVGVGSNAHVLSFFEVDIDVLKEEGAL